MSNKTDSIFSFDEIHVCFILKCLSCLDMDTKFLKLSASYIALSIAYIFGWAAYGPSPFVIA